MLFNLISIDPGGGTGLASAIYNPDIFSGDDGIRYAFEHHIGEAIQITGEPNQQVLEIFDYIEDRIKKSGGSKGVPYDVRTIVLCEGFVVPTRHVRSYVLIPHAIKEKLQFYIWLELLDQTGGVDEWREQTPVERTVITDDQLQRWGLWQPGRGSKDAMAALKHLFVLARKLENER